MIRYTVLRLPCLPEDEGRVFVIKSYKTKIEAEKWIKDQKGEYFSPDDYKIVET